MEAIYILYCIQEQESRKRIIQVINFTVEIDYKAMRICRDESQKDKRFMYTAVEQLISATIAAAPTRFNQLIEC